jgi:BAG domain
MLFVLTPQGPSPAYFDPEQVYQDYRRREYVSALQEQQQRAQFERELALEEQRHRQALNAITRQEAARRQHQASLQFAARRGQQAAPGSCDSGRCGQPAPEEILRRRQARQQEEERLSREFHKHILSQIFGVAADEAAPSAPKEPAQEPVASVSTFECCLTDMQELTPCVQTSAKGKESTVKRPRNEEPEPHWSAAPERARALAEITSIMRAFTSLKNTFVFPSGPLERLPESDVPRLAYNPTNASIHAYEHALAELLTKLDGVESHGFKGVREARKQLVVKIEKVLEDLEKQVAERLTEGSSPANAPTAIPESPVVAHAEEKEVQDVVMQEEAQPEVNEASNTTEGYDVEIEVAEVTMQEPSDSTVALEPTEVTASPIEEAVLPTPAAESVVESSTEIASPAQPEESHEPTVNPAVLPASESDEESEIEDAVHIEISSDEEDVVDAKHPSDDAHSDTEGAFEMI